MRLEKLKIKGFQCFLEETEIEMSDLTAFIGANNSGKTAVLSALNKLFSDEIYLREIKKSDFHLPSEEWFGSSQKETSDEEKSLFIEAVFTFPELNESNKNSIPFFFDSFIINESNGEPKLRVRLESCWTKSANIDGAIETNVYFIHASESTAVAEENKRKASRKSLDKVRFIYIPAVRDPLKHLKNSTGSMIFRLLNNMNWDEKIKKELLEHASKLDEVFKTQSGVATLNKAIEKQWKEYNIGKKFTNANLRLNNADLESLIKKTELVFSPTPIGEPYDIHQMGDGYKSLLYISLVDSMLMVEDEIQKDMEAKSKSENGSKQMIDVEVPYLTIVGIEEPENHIAPQLLGKITQKLISISKKSNAQAIITSHAPSIIKRVDPEDIRYLKNDNNQSFIKQISLPKDEKLMEQKKYIKEAVTAYPELYFSKLVILGEGDSEEIILSKLIDKMGINVDSNNIAIVPLGGKHVNHFWRLLDDLQIPHITLLDFDMDRCGGGWGRIKYVLNQLNLYGKLDQADQNDADLIKIKESIEERNPLPKSIEEYDKIKGMLEKKDVFFSGKLDIDFLMLEHYKEDYINTLSNNEGPTYLENDKKEKFADYDFSQPEYSEIIQQKIKTSISQTLKGSGGDGSLYSEKEKKLMVWYSYFFLGRGKPATHHAFLSQITNEELLEKTPKVLRRMIERVRELI